MSGINFKGVEEAKDKMITRPGTIGVFTVSDVKFANSEQKGTYYMGISFSREEDEFNHRFYLSQKALGRVVSLVKHAAGVKLEDDNVLEEKLIALLKGKKIGLKVTARIDEENGKAYADLSFGGFASDPDKVSELHFNTKEEELNARAKAIYESAASAKPEEPATTATGTDPVEEEIF